MFQAESFLQGLPDWQTGKEFSPGWENQVNKHSSYNLHGALKSQKSYKSPAFVNPMVLAQQGIFLIEEVCKIVWCHHDPECLFPMLLSCWDTMF